MKTKNDYRIKEYGGFFTVEERCYVGLFKKREEWIDVIGVYDTLEEARKAIRRFTSEPNYHPAEEKKEKGEIVLTKSQVGMWVNNYFDSLRKTESTKGQNRLLTTTYLRELHPELTVKDALSLLFFCQKHTITHEQCYGNGEIMYPKWKASIEKSLNESISTKSDEISSKPEIAPWEFCAVSVSDDIKKIKEDIELIKKDLQSKSLAIKSIESSQNSIEKNTEKEYGDLCLQFSRFTEHIENKLKKFPIKDDKCPWDFNLVYIKEDITDLQNRIDLVSRINDRKFEEVIEEIKSILKIVSGSEFKSNTNDITQTKA